MIAARREEKDRLLERAAFVGAFGDWRDRGPRRTRRRAPAPLRRRTSARDTRAQTTGAAVQRAFLGFCEAAQTHGRDARATRLRLAKPATAGQAWHGRLAHVRYVAAEVTRRGSADSTSSRQATPPYIANGMNLPQPPDVGCYFRRDWPPKRTRRRKRARPRPRASGRPPASKPAQASSPEKFPGPSSPSECRGPSTATARLWGKPRCNSRN